jgi:CHASE3 domain sensor protein
MDVPGLFAVGAVAVVLVAGAVLQNEQKMTKNVSSWI